MQKKIKIPNNENKVIFKRPTSNKFKNMNLLNSKKKDFSKNYDFETNPVDLTITTDSTTTTDTTKRIYIYRKNMSKQKNSIGQSKKILLHCSSLDNINSNKNKINRFNTLENKDYNNNFEENTNTISNINTKCFENYDNKIKINKNKYNNKINDISPNRKYYKNNNFTINSGPNIFKKGLNLNINNNYFYNQIFYNTGIQKIIKKKEIINIEDLLILEEKFNDIIFAIFNKSNIANECFELINFYSQSSLYNKFENYFKDYKTKKIVHSSILLIIFDLTLIYHVSFDDFFVNSFNDYLSNILEMNHQAYLLICDYISNKVSSSEKGNIWVKKLRQMINNNIYHLNINNNKDFKIYFFKNNSINKNLNIPLIEVNYYIFATQKCLTILLKNLSEDDDLKSLLIDIYNNIFEVSIEDLYKLFKKKIFRIINKNGSIGGSDISLYEANHIEIKEPFLNFKNLKKFTLVLDLDETLICFKMYPENNKGLLRVRPGLFSFLLNMKKYYELIIFTSATPEYADPLLQAIEKGQKIFDYKLYRQHTIIYDNEIIKDISKLGRSLDKIIIVDNLQQNFKLQKENGIMIKPFWGEDNEDTALFALNEILKKIAIEFDDVRKGIIKYKDDILSKVSSTVSRQNF